MQRFHVSLCVDKRHFPQSRDYKGCSVLTVRGDGVVPGHEAVDGNLIDDVEQQEGHTGEAQRLQQTPCVAWKEENSSHSLSFKDSHVLFLPLMHWNTEEDLSGGLFF